MKNTFVLGIIFIFLPIAIGQPNLYAIECPFPEPPIDLEEECREYTACAYSPSDTGSHCHMEKNDLAGYIVTSEKTITERGFKVNLTKYDEGRTMFHADIDKLVFEVINHEDYHLQIKIYDPSVSRYEVPFPINIPDESGTKPLYAVEVSEVQAPFSFNVKRNSTGMTIFETLGPLSFEDQFIQFTTSLASPYLYGLGEAYHTTFKHSFDTRKTTPMFSRDQTLLKDEINEYGVHPYYVNIEDNEGYTHSVLFYNSNAMEYSTFTLDDDTHAFTYKTTGGIIDLHFFLGPWPEDVNVQYAKAIGTSVFPPYWSLGFHLSRYGYLGIANLEEVRNNTKNAGIPQDGQMCDIDYMMGYRDFTYNDIYWPDLPAFTDELHEDGVKLTLILDAAIDFANEAFVRGKQRDVFVKWMDESLVPEDQEPEADNYIVGYLYPINKTVIPDFMNPEARSWWSDECETFHNSSISFDGLWIDATEPNNFGTNTYRPWNYPFELPNWSLKCPSNAYDSPPFPTKASYHEENESKRLSDKTICMSGLQSDGTKSYLHYDVHNLYGLCASIATYKSLENIFPGKRQFVLTGTTFPGSGSYTAYYLGVNYPTWEHMRQSIIGILEFNLFSVPFVGANICGYFGDSNEALCARWMQLGAFYPFSRNHNSEDSIAQDPGNPDWPLVNSVSRDVLLLRYKYLPYLYLLFYKASTQGSSVARPLFNVFPSDIGARDVDDQFFWGDGIMIAPVVSENNTREVYFPDGVWYELVDGILASLGSESVLFDVPMECIPVYVRGGVILPFQEPDVTTSISRNNSFGLTVALDENETAEGEIYWDDGESIYSMETSFTSFVQFSENTLIGIIDHGAAIVTDLNYGTIQFYGYPTEPTGVVVNEEDLDESMWEFDIDNKVLVLTVNEPMSENITVIIDVEYS